MKLIKYFAAVLSAFTMCFSPLAEALNKADQQKELVNQFLKGVGLTTKKMTVGEFWRQSRHVYPKALQNKMDLWVAKNYDQLMPSVEATSFKDSEGREQVRVAFNRDGQTLTLTLIGDDAQFMKVNGVMFSRKDLADPEAMANKMMTLDATVQKTVDASSKLPILRKDVVMNVDEFNKLTRAQRAEYLVRLRLTIAAVQKVYKAKYGTAALDQYNKKYEWVQQFLFGEEAQAKGGLVGKDCVVAGYLSVYGENQSCGGKNMGDANLQAQIKADGATCSTPNSVPCNPMVYGFSDGNSAFCVSKSSSGGSKPDVYNATTLCNQMSPIETPQQKAKIVESYLHSKGKDIKLVLNANGKLSKAQRDEIQNYFSGLNGLIGDATKLCGGPDFQKIKSKRTDQDNACTALLSRAFDLQAFTSDPVPLPVPDPQPDPLPVAKCSEKAGSVAAHDGSCQCKEGTLEKTNEQSGESSCEVVLENKPPKVEKLAKDDDCGFFCKNSWIFPVGLILGGGLLAWWLLRNKNKPTPSVYTPPAGPDPLPRTCDSPSVLIGGICQTPTVPLPPIVITPPETGTLVDGRQGGGIRRSANQ